jgi:hypothetical protein
MGVLAVGDHALSSAAPHVERHDVGSGEASMRRAKPSKAWAWLVRPCTYTMTGAPWVAPKSR